eukprot:gene4496-4749_t
MPQLQQTIIASQPVEPPVKSKSASITFEGKHGKSATITFTKTIPAQQGEEMEEEEEGPQDPVVPVPTPVPVPVPVPTPVPVPVSAEGLQYPAELNQ